MPARPKPRPVQSVSSDRELESLLRRAEQYFKNRRMQVVTAEAKRKKKRSTAA